MLKHLVDQAIFLSLLRGHEIIPLGVLLDDLQRLAGHLAEQTVHPVLDADDVVGVDLDIGGLTLHPAQGLVDHDLAVGQRIALALGAGRQQKGAHAGRHADADGGHVGKSEEEYLSKGAYIANFVDEKKVCEDIILIAAIDEKKRLVTIRYKKLTGDIVEQTLLFEEYADDFLSESFQKHLVRFDIFDIVKQTGQVDRKEVREHWENAKLSFWEQRKCMKKVTDMEKVLGEWFVVFQNAVSYLAEKGVMNQSPLVQSDYELFSCESKNLGKKLKRYCEILSNASDYIMGEEK